MVTHNLGQAHRLGDEILFLHQGRLVERAPGRPLPETPGLARGRPISRRRVAMVMTRTDIRRAAGRGSCVRGAGAGPLHHRRVDDVDRAVGTVRLHSADLREEDRDPGARRRAGHRPGARPRAARRRRRRVRPREGGRGEIPGRGPRRQAASRDVQRLRADRAEERSREDRRRQGHHRSAEEDPGGAGAVRLARRQERHAHGRARPVESVGHRHRQGEGRRGIATPGRGWVRRSTRRRR